MYTVNFIPANSPNALTFVFKSYKNGDDLFRKGLKAIKDEDFIECEDDFSTKAGIKGADISSVTFSEYEQDMDKNGDLQLIQHKSSLKTQKKAENDIGLQLLSKPSAMLKSQ